MPNYKQDFYGKPLKHDWRTRWLLPKQIPLISNKYKVPLDGYKRENLPENHASPTVVKCLLSWGMEPLENEIVWTYLTIWNLNRNNKYFLLFVTISKYWKQLGMVYNKLHKTFEIKSFLFTFLAHHHNPSNSQVLLCPGKKMPLWFSGCLP